MHKDCYLLNDNNRYFDEDDECYRCCHCNKSTSNLDCMDADLNTKCYETETKDLFKSEDKNK